MSLLTPHPRPSSPRRGELAQGLLDRLSHAFQIVERFVVPEPEDSKPCGVQILGALSVVGKCKLFSVLTSIQFHNQAVFDAGKIGDVRPNRVLSPEFGPQCPVSQSTPHHRLGLGLIPPQSTRLLCFGSPHTSQSERRAFPPSPWGEGPGVRGLPSGATYDF